ncbi:unnamed protein product [Paramecium primaurelia]|uniref:Uncharacterized protein n=1 Tax=Paramecium primaurelia TaxID=5886 RepID=A0A8S1QS54_PARPR|nr:unnamed protein product [Paramecium primaurelia]
MKQSFGQIKLCNQIQNIAIHQALKRRVQEGLVNIMKQQFGQINLYKQIQRIFFLYAQKAIHQDY